jgi:hypothetical protein
MVARLEPSGAFVVTRLLEGGSAARCGLLQQGDLLLQAYL